MSNKCSFKGCDKPVFVKETDLGPLCNGHYKQYKQAKAKGNTPNLKPLRKYQPKSYDPDRPQCKWINPKTNEQCPNNTWGAYEYCQTHQRQYQNGEELREIREYNFQLGKTCSTENCNNPIKAKGLCSKCYSKLRNKQKQEKLKNDN